MKKNLLFLQSLIFAKKQNHFKNLLLVISFFISSSLSAQNPLFLAAPVEFGSSGSIQKIVPMQNGNAFFNTVDLNNHFTDTWGLWLTDGTPQGIRKLILTSPPLPGGTNSFITTEATLLTQLGDNKVAFAGNDEGGYGEIWVSDGTKAGTFVLEQFFGSSSSGAPVSNITTMGDNVVYSVITNDNKLQLHKTDGTYAGTSMIYDFGDYTKTGVAYFKTIGSLLYFELTNGTTHNNEIWRTDGTTAGTYQVKDLGLNYGFASDFMSFNNNIYFITISSTYGDYIWKSDGTNAGTAPLKQISTTFNSDNLYPSYAAVENNIILANNLLYFVANDGIHGKELWKTNGTAAGTSMIFDFNPGSVGSNPNYLTVLNDQLYFSANTSLFPVGTELYYYTGSQFSQPIDIFPGVTGSNPSNLTFQNNTLVFSATSNTNDGEELWVSGGSANNTLEIDNITKASSQSSSPTLITSGNKNFFAAYYDVNQDGLANEECLFAYTPPTKIWAGSVSGDGSIADNWFPSGVPSRSSTDDIIIPPSTPNNLTQPSLFVHSFYNNGGTVNVGTGLCLMSGDFFNEGIINNPDQGGGYYGVFGIVSSVGVSAIHLAGSTGVYNGQLTLSGGSNVQLTANSYFPVVRVEGADTIYLGYYTLWVDKFNLQTPTIVTNGGGIRLLVGASPVTFRIGTDVSSQTPVTITNNNIQDYFTVHVTNGVLKDGTAGDTIKQQAVNKTWNIEEYIPGGSNADITLQWNASDELPDFNRNNVYLNHYTSGAWDAGTPGIASGSSPYTFSRNGITSFSPFSISSSTSVLPVTLISFNANKLKNTVQLNWQTSSEKNISFYTIERSADGNAFSKLDQIDALVTGASIKNYSFTDNQPFQGTNFYRLKMIDADGKFTYSKIVAIKMDDKNSTLQIFPNPVKDILNVQINGANENAIIQIIDMNGRKVKEEKISLNGNTSVSVDINNLSKGTYNLLLKSKSVNEQKKFVKE